MRNDIYLQLTPEEIRDNPFIDGNGDVAFYRTIIDKCPEAHFTYDDVEATDPGYIAIAPDIYMSWFAGTVNNAERESIARLVATYGPKIDKNLYPGQVCIRPEWCILRDGTVWPPMPD